MNFKLKVLLVFFTANVTADETRCSKYDFEEKVLEKLVRMEFNVDQYKMDLESMKSDMDKRLEKIESISSIVNNTIKEFDSMVTETITTLMDNASRVLADITHNASTTTTALEQEFSNLEKRIMDKLVAKRDTNRPVVFKARLSSNIAVSYGQTIKFPVVMLNIGDTSSGIFTVPVNGTYMFDIVLCPHNDKYTNVAIVIDDEQNTEVTFYSSKGHTCFSANAVALLQTGQEVKVAVLSKNSGGAMLDQDNARLNTFSGVRVHVS